MYIAEIKELERVRKLKHDVSGIVKWKHTSPYEQVLQALARVVHRDVAVFEMHADVAHRRERMVFQKRHLLQVVPEGFRKKRIVAKIDQLNYALIVFRHVFRHEYPRISATCNLLADF